MLYPQNNGVPDPTFAGTYTVVDGKIVAANVVPTS